MDFSWVNIYNKMAHKILEYKNKTVDFVGLMYKCLEDAGLMFSEEKGSNLDFDGEKRCRYDEIDPISFMNRFDMYFDENRKKLIEVFQNNTGLEVELPNDFDGIPLTNPQMSTVIRFKDGREKEDVSNIWELFEIALVGNLENENDKIKFINFYDKVTSKPIAKYNISVGLFKIRPDVFINLDKTNRDYIKKRFNIKINICPNGEKYLEILNEIKNKLKEDNETLLDFSYNAWNDKGKREKHYWIYSPGENAKMWNECLNDGVMLLGYDEIGDLEQFESSNKLFLKLKEVYNKENPMNDKCALDDFKNAMQPGDIVIVKKGIYKLLGYGEVTSDYYYDNDRKTYQHVRNVNWIKTGEWNVSDIEGERQVVMKTLTDLTKYSDYPKKLIRLINGESDLDMESFKEYLEKECKFAERTVYRYISIIKMISSDFELTEKELTEKELYNSKKEIIFKDEKFKDKDTVGNGIYTAALNHYGEFLDSIKKDKNYFWLNANPKIWSFSELKIGEIIEYTAINENGNKRRIYKNYQEAKKGDMVIAYESTHTKAIVGICVIEEELRDDILKVKKIEALINPIPYSEIKDIEELANMEYIQNPQGSLFALTENEYNIIIDIVREANSNPDAKKEFPKYTKEDFLNDVYITDKEYDKLVNLLYRKKNVILQGAPGVGKTYMAKRLAYSIMGEKDSERIKCIQFHQSYSYEDFIEGFRPTETTYELEKGIFYNFCKLAENNSKQPYFFIIDEINRGNLSKIFGELLMLIESDKRGEKLNLAYSKIGFSVPSNLYIIGMMNTADRSLALIDYALRRRFAFYKVKPAFENEKFIQYKNNFNNAKFIKLIELIEMINIEINNDLSLGEGFEIGHSYFCELDNVTDEDVESIITYEILPLIEEYWFDDMDKYNEWKDKLNGVVNG